MEINVKQTALSSPYYVGSGLVLQSLKNGLESDKVGSLCPWL